MSQSEACTPQSRESQPTGKGLQVCQKPAHDRPMQNGLPASQAALCHCCSNWAPAVDTLLIARFSGFCASQLTAVQMVNGDAQIPGESAPWAHCRVKGWLKALSLDGDPDLQHEGALQRLPDEPGHKHGARASGRRMHLQSAGWSPDPAAFCQGVALQLQSDPSILPAWHDMRCSGASMRGVRSCSMTGRCH